MNTVAKLCTIQITIFYQKCHCGSKSLFFSPSFETHTNAMFFCLHLGNTCRYTGANFSANAITIHSAPESCHRQKRLIKLTPIIFFRLLWEMVNHQNPHVTHFIEVLYLSQTINPKPILFPSAVTTTDVTWATSDPI